MELEPRQIKQRRNLQTWILAEVVWKKQPIREFEEATQRERWLGPVIHC